MTAPTSAQGIICHKQVYTYISAKSRLHKLQLLVNTLITIVTTLIGKITQVIFTLIHEAIAKCKQVIVGKELRIAV